MIILLSKKDLFLLIFDAKTTFVVDEAISKAYLLTINIQI